MARAMRTAGSRHIPLQSHRHLPGRFYEIRTSAVRRRAARRARLLPAPQLIVSRSISVPTRCYLRARGKCAHVGRLDYIPGPRQSDPRSSLHDTLRAKRRPSSNDRARTSRAHLERVSRARRRRRRRRRHRTPMSASPLALLYERRREDVPPDPCKAETQHSRRGPAALSITLPALRREGQIRDCAALSITEPLDAGISLGLYLAYAR